MLAMTALSAPIPSPQAQTDAATPSTTTIAAEKPKSILEGRSSAPAPRDAGPVDRIMAWIQRQQRALNSRLTQSVRSLKKESSVAAALLLRTSPHFPRLAPLRQSLDLHCSAAAPVLMHCKFGLDQGASVRTGPDTGNGEDP